jgi:hypothetical protein
VDFQRGSLEDAIAASKEGYKCCDLELEYSEVHDLAPHCIRACLERALRARGRQYEAKVSAKRNRKGTAFHSVVTFGPVLITASRVATPETIVRRAEFRKTYAMSQQLDLFDPQPHPDPFRYLYALLIYGPDPSKRYPIGFAEIVFPLSNGLGYADERINLCAKFPEVIEQLDTPVEQIEDTATPRFKADIEKAEGL